jgi:branched-chain amino acid transport system substrate-binding protein
MLGRRGLLELTPATLAGPAVMDRAVLGAAPIGSIGIRAASGGFNTSGQPAIACLAYAGSEPDEAGGLLGRPVQHINNDAQSNILSSTPGSQPEPQRGAAR